MIGQVNRDAIDVRSRGPQELFMPPPTTLTPDCQRSVDVGIAELAILEPPASAELDSSGREDHVAGGIDANARPAATATPASSKAKGFVACRQRGSAGPHVRAHDVV